MNTWSAIEHANVADAFGYSSIRLPDYDMQDENMDTLHLVQDSLSGLMTVCQLACWNEPEYLPSFQNLRNVNARGSTFNSVGQNQYNNYLVNNYFTLNINEVDDPVCVFGIP